MGSSIDQMAGQRLLGACGANQLGDTGASMAASGAAGYVPNIHHPEIMRSILAAIVETGDAIGAAGPARTILAVTVDNWLIDELAALGSDVADRELENAL